MRSWVRWTFLVVLLATLMVAAFAGWLALTPQGSRWALTRLPAFLPMSLTMEGIEGSLVRGLHVRRLTVSDDNYEVVLDDLRVVFAWPSIFVERLVLEAASVGTVTIRTGLGDANPKPLSMVLPALPVDVEFRAVSVGAVAINDVDARWLPQLSAVALWTDESLHLSQVRADADAYRVTADLTLGTNAGVRVVGRARWRLSEADVAGELDLTGSLAELGVALQVYSPWQARVDGAAQVLGAMTPYVDLSFDVPVLPIPGLSVIELSGTAQGNINAYEASATADVEVLQNTFRKPVRGRLDLSVDGTISRLGIRAASFDTDVGSLGAEGEITAEAGVGLQINLLGLDPGLFVAGYEGGIDGAADLTVRQGSIRLADVALSGVVNDTPINVDGDVQGFGRRWSSDGLRFSSELNHASARGSWRDGEIEVSARFDLPKLGDLMPEVKGDAVGDISVRGELDALSGHVRVASTRLSFSGVEAEGLLVNAHGEGEHVRMLQVDAQRLAAWTIDVTQVSLLGTGPRTDLQGELSWTLDDREGRIPFVLAVGEEVGLNIDASARLAAPFDDWDVDRDVALSMAEGRLSASPHCWQRVGGTAKVCTDALEVHEDGAELAGRLVDLRAATIAALSPGLPEMDGVLNAEWRLAQHEKQWRGEATALVDDWVLLVEGNADPQVLPDLHAQLHFDDGIGRLGFRAGAAADPLLKGEGEVIGISEDAPIAGELQLDVQALGWLAAVDPRVQDVAGHMTGRALISGTLSAPELRAEVRVADGQLVMIDPRVSLDDVEARAVMEDISRMAVTAAGSAGEGSFSLSGQIVEPFAARSVVLDLQTQGLTIETPELTATADSNLTLTYAPQVLAVRGEVGVPYARLKVAELPESAVARSRDVVVLDRPLPRRGNEFRPDIELTLGDDVRFEAFGLEGRLRGHVKLHQASTGALALTGQLEVYRGVFAAYGMSLEVKSGRLVFAGPPDNPFVDARAVRVIDNPDGRVEVGLHLTGPARSLKTTLFSTPTMAERDILSYLVFGQPMSANSSEEDEQLGTTASALGMVPAGLLLVGLRDVLGLDELTATGESQEDMTFIAGTRITEDVFVRYTYQTVTSMSALLIRLALTDRWALEATAAQAPGLDVIYRVGR